METEETIVEAAPEANSENIKFALSVLERGLFEKPNVRNEDFACFYQLKKLFN
jgi:hypothetical protein